jgi:hypothetical protein
VERASRLIVVASTALAIVAHAWLTAGQPGLGVASIAAFLAGFALAYFSQTMALAVVAGAAYVAPALLWLAFGRVDYHLLMVWLAAFVGVVLARFDWAAWHLPSRWRFPLVAWALVIAVSWPIVAGREIDFSMVAARTITTTNAAFLAPPGVAAAFVVIIALAQLLGILWIDLLWARFTAAGLATFQRVIIVPVIAGVAMSCLVAIYQAAVDTTWMNQPVWSNVERAGGLTNDANSVGIGAALWAPLVVVLAWQANRMWVGLFTFVALAAGMWASGSRTALLAFGAGSLGLAMTTLKQRGLWQPRLGRVMTLVGAALFVLAMAIVPRDFESTNPLQRAFARVPRLEAGELSRFAGELWNRFGYGPAAAEILREHPITGVGIGAFHIVATDYIFLDTGRNVGGDNAQNWWRHQIAELGLLGAVPSLWFSLVVLGLLRGRDDPPPDVTVLRGVIIGVGLASLLGVPTQHPATWVSFLAVVFWLAVRLSTPGGREGKRPPALWILAAALALSVAIGIAMSAAGNLRVVQRALRTGLPYAYGLSASDGLSAYGETRRLARDAVWIEPVRHRWLQLTLWPLHSDVGANPVAAQVGLDNRTVVHHTFVDAAPVSYVLEVPAAQFVVLESHASRGALGDWVLQSALSWHREIPAGIPDDRVIRRADAAQRPE